MIQEKLNSWPGTCLAEGERTELAMNIRTEDGMTNGAENVIKLVQ